MPVPLLRWAIRHRHSAVDEERGGRIVARHTYAYKIWFDLEKNFPKIFVGWYTLAIVKNERNSRSLRRTDANSACLTAR